MAPRSSSVGASDRDGSSELKRKSNAVFSWQDVAQHNTAESAWVIVERKVYDVTSWIDRHPGGREMLLLAAGRECTDLLASYHPFSDKPAAVLSKFQIGVVEDSEFPAYAPDSGFYSTLRERVGAYFQDNNVDPRDPWPGVWRMTLVFLTAACCYAAVNNIIDVGQTGRVMAAVVFGIVQALPLLHVMHDSSHTAFGGSETWWKAGGRLCMEWYAGASMISWHHQHVVGHHIYTNVFEADPDLPVVHKGDPRRLVSRQTWARMYKYQHLYLPVLYGVLGLKFRIQDFTDTFFSLTNGPIRVNMYDSMLVRLFAVKVFWATWRIVIPLVFLEVPHAQFWPLFLVTEVVTGYWLSFNFQVSHVSEVADYPQGEAKGPSIDDEWAVSQVKSSVDYSHGNWWMTFLCGALNYQIVHHLFPGVSQYHYPAIAPIVQEVCDQYGVEYVCLPGFMEAFRLHLTHLRNMGAVGKAAHID